MDKKYKLTEESIDFRGTTLYRIEALKDFGDVKKGDKGGFVESENNLSQEGDCWIYDNAKVYDCAYVCDNAKICGNARVYDNAKVFGNAKVYGDAYVWGNAEVYDNVEIGDDVIICDNAEVFGNAKVYGNAKVCDNAQVYDNAKVWDNAKVYCDAEVCGNAQISGNAEIKNNTDYIVFKNWWSSGRYFTWTKSNNMWKVGCFYGTGEELIKKAYKDNELSGREYERLVKYVETILQDSK